MKKFIIFITIFLLPLVTNAVVTDYNLSSEVGGFSGMNFNAPVMIVINIIAAILMVFAIIDLMVGYTRWHYLAGGNVAAMKLAKETLKRSVIEFCLVFIVLAIDLFIK